MNKEDFDSSLGNKQSAFSLVELLVAISIVAILTAVGIGSFTSLQKNGRDTQRQSDLRMLQSALQQYYANENHYPDTMALNAVAALTNCTGVTGSCTVNRTYLSSTPIDPVAGTSTPYCYQSLKAAGSASSCALGGADANLCHYYKLSAWLENSPANTLSCGSVSTYNFQVTPLSKLA